MTTTTDTSTALVGIPFSSAAAAWFWTMQRLAARADGAAPGYGSTHTIRPCEPDDVVKCLDRLYRQRKVDLIHARILREYGARGSAPNPSNFAERGDAKVWLEAMRALRPALIVRGIVREERR